MPFLCKYFGNKTFAKVKIGNKLLCIFCVVWYNYFNLRGMEMNKTLFIIDGNSILYREYYALPGLMNKYGEYTGALFGFSKIIIEIVTKFKPSHIAVAFDAGKITFRNEMYSGYKATRKPMPEDLRSQVGPVKDLLNTMGIKSVEQVGIEGDDVIGSLVHKFHDMDKVIITGDRDSFQLVDDRTQVYLNKRGLSELRIMDEQALYEEFGLKPSQMVFVKSLMGDASDNIPGVKGIGEKTAVSLINKYGSLDAVYEHIDELSAKVKQNLLEFKTDAYMSLDLAKIKCDADLDVSLQDLEVKFPFPGKVKEFFQHNDFKSLVKRDELYDLSGSEVMAKTTKKVEIVEILELTELANIIKGHNELSLLFFETEFHFAVDEKEYVLKFSPLLGIDEWTVCETLKPFVENKNNKLILFDYKNECHRFNSVGADILCQVFDCMIAEHLVLGESVTKIEQLLESPENELKTVASIMREKQVELFNSLQEMGMVDLYGNIEMKLARVLFDMEKIGFKVDTDRLHELDEKYDRELKELTAEIYRVVGREFNINSPKQLSAIIYDELALSRSRKKSTASEVLEKIADRHPLIPLVIRYRKVAKFSSSFIKNMYEHIDKAGYVHTKFNQTLTTTGRLSSSDPNLQNIPIRGDESREIRSMFVAGGVDRVLVDVDYSQIELRILAHVTGDDVLIKAFNEGLDIHTQTAMDIFGLPKELITSDMRRQAKVVNFGIIYGMSDFGLSEDLKIPIFEARAYIDKFFSAHPKIQEYMQASVSLAKETGRVSTILGRTRKMSDINSDNRLVRARAERATYNMPIQGSASDIIKLAMVNVAEVLNKSGLDARLIMQVHDELIVDCKKSEQDEVLDIVKNCMSGAMKLAVPLDVDGSVSYRWSEGH